MRFPIDNGSEPVNPLFSRCLERDILKIYVTLYISYNIFKDDKDPINGDIEPVNALKLKFL